MQVVSGGIPLRQGFVGQVMILKIKVIEFIFRLFYNDLEPTGMLGQGRKKSYIAAVHILH